MRRVLICLALIAAQASFVLYAYVSPGKPTGYVNDFAEVLTPSTKEGLERELMAFASSTSNEIAVVTIRTVGSDETIESYAVRLFEEWKIGRKDVDNGILFLIAVDDHAARIEVGYGLEGALPDSVASRILREDVLPKFKENKFDEGVSAGVTSIEKATQGEYVAAQTQRTDKSGNAPGAFLLFFVYVLGMFVLHLLSRTKSWWLGGVIGLIIGVLSGPLLFSWGVIGTSFLALLLGGIGLALDYLLSRHGPSGPFGGGSMGPWWGTRTGGPSSGSSFGGFGGGSSGGGGASGRW